jgi:hypothetical protein
MFGFPKSSMVLLAAVALILSSYSCAKKEKSSAEIPRQEPVAQVSQETQPPATEIPAHASVAEVIDYTDAKDIEMDGKAAIGKIAKFGVTNSAIESDRTGPYVVGQPCTSDDQTSLSLLSVYFTPDKKADVKSWSGCRTIKMKIARISGGIICVLLLDVGY